MKRCALAAGVLVGYQATGSGAVIEGGRVLTAAHVVNGQTFVHLVEIQMDADRSPRLAALLKEKAAGDAPAPVATAVIEGGN